MTNIQNVVFDLGGVIISLDKERSIKRFKEIGVKNIESFLDAYEQKGLFLELENGGVDAEGFCFELGKSVGRELSLDEVAHCWLGFAAEVPVFKLDYILQLRRKYNVYILSNTNPFIYEWAKTSGFSDAGRPVTDYCDRFYASYELKVTKPDPHIFELMIKDAGMQPDRTLFVDDGSLNIETAKQLGFITYQPENREDWREPIDRILLR